MSEVLLFAVRRLTTYSAWAAVLLLELAATQAQSQAPEVASGAMGRIELESPILPPASVEFDLSQSKFRDLFGLGDAAMAGAAETFLESLDSNSSSPEVRLAAEQLAAARQIMQLASEVVQEVRIRVHKDFPEHSKQIEALNSDFDNRLAATNWDHVVRGRDGDESVRISVLRNDGAIRGLFVIAGSDEGIFLANVVCDVSPENVKKFTAAATKIGMEHGLQQALESKMKKLHQ